MLKARITNSSTESARNIIEQLRLLGYDIETAAPGESSDGHADLEIQLETCNTEQALERAAELAKSENANVYIAAGCFPQRNAPAAAQEISSARPSVTDTINGVAAGLQNKRDLLAKALREQRAMMREARRAERRRREQEAALRAAEEAERELLARQAETARLAEERERILRQQEEEADRLRIIQQEQAALRDAAEYDATNPLIDGSVAQIEKSAPRIRKWVAHSSPVFGLEWGLESKLQPSSRRASIRMREWRAAAVTAAILAALFMIGWSIARRSPVSPLPATMVNGRIEQKTPFGAATLKPLVPTVRSRKPPALSQSRHGRVSPPQKSRLNHALGHTRARHSGEQDDVAQDSVRYFHSSPTAPTSHEEPPQHASLKHYSDMQ